jgi:hypothetical protein
MPADDAIIEIARLYSRPEALTVQAMLDAAGILCHVGGDGHGSVESIPVALGGYRLTVPAFHYGDASAIIADMLAEPASIAESQVNRVWALLLIVSATIIPTAIVGAFVERERWSEWMLSTLTVLTTPAVPQGRGDYRLANPTE